MVQVPPCTQEFKLDTWPSSIIPPSWTSTLPATTVRQFYILRISSSPSTLLDFDWGLDRISFAYWISLLDSEVEQLPTGSPALVWMCSHPHSGPPCAGPFTHSGLVLRSSQSSTSGLPPSLFLLSCSRSSQGICTLHFPWLHCSHLLQPLGTGESFVRVECVVHTRYQ